MILFYYIIYNLTYYQWTANDTLIFLDHIVYAKYNNKVGNRYT